MLTTSILLFIASLAQPGSAAGEAPPNIVIIYTDDQGWFDVGANGGRHVSTPNIDRMAEQGRRFTDFYTAQPVCSASRTALLTGCYPNRLGITGALGPWANHGIHDDETTLGELCRDRGYATAAYGKWHLGHHAQFLPPNHGFDDYFGIPYSNDMWPMHPTARKSTYPPLPLIEDAETIEEQPDQRRFTTEFTERAVQFMREHADEPFLVYLAHPMPHVPLFVNEERDGATGMGLYADVIGEIDWSVGQVLDTLHELDLDERTLVIFASDNGPWLSYGNHGGQTGPYREGKGTTFEGGVRVPCVMWMPGRIPAGTVCREPMMTIDVLPTVAELIDAPLPSRPIDGRSATGLVFDEPGARSPQEYYLFYYHANDLEAIRSGRWKLHLPHGYRSMGNREPGRDGIPGQYNYGVRIDMELYDLETDPGETTDVSDQYPEVMERMLGIAETARADLGDTLTKREGTGRRQPGRLPKEEDSP
ncbi:MAG: sulfatase [Phycisphaerales bacterium]|nr:sulfatase [Phycisphaerales bacterium]